MNYLEASLNILALGVIFYCVRFIIKDIMRSERNWNKILDKMEEDLVQLKIMTDKFEKAIDLLQVYCRCENRQHQYCIKGKHTCGDCEKEIKQKTDE